MEFKTDFSTDKTTIGWIGTGVMGKSMMGNLMEAGYEGIIYTRTQSKARDLLDKGAKWAETPAQAAKEADIVFSIVGFPEDVRQVYMGEDNILEGATKNTVVVDMTTTKPSLAMDIYKKAKEQGVYAVDAPVSGGDVGARNGSLAIMVGGDKEVVDAIMPLFDIMGKNIVHQGPAGAGQHTKMCNQITIAGTMIGVCESLLYGYQAGLDLDTVLKSIGGGAAACWTLDNLAPRIIKRDFDPGFYVDHFIKDMAIALEEANRMELAMPGLALVHQLYTALKAQGHGQKGTQALTLALEKISNKEKK